MIAFHGKDAIKAEYLARVQAHAAADEIVHGTYWENGKGCAVGCTIHSDEHAAYETTLGIPRILAHLEDKIFEGMGNGEAKHFPVRFLSAIRVGADLSLVWPKFAVWLLTDPDHGVLRYTKKDSPQRKAIMRVADLYRDLKDWDGRDKIAFRKASADADAATAIRTASAACAAYTAAYTAACADAYTAACAAACADAYTAAYTAACAADTAAKQKSYKRQADKLIELLEAA